MPGPQTAPYPEKDLPTTLGTVAFIVLAYLLFLYVLLDISYTAAGLQMVDSFLPNPTIWVAVVMGIWIFYYLTCTCAPRTVCRRWPRVPCHAAW